MSAAPLPLERFTPLLVAVRAGREAAGELLHAYRPYLLHIAEAEQTDALRAAHGASGLVNDAYLRAVQALWTFQGDSEPEFRLWLRKILLNVTRNADRDERAAKRDGGPAVLADERVPDPGPSPSGDAVLREETLRFQQKVRALPDKQRLAIVLQEYGLSDAQIADALGETEGNVRQLRSRGLRAVLAGD